MPSLVVSFELLIRLAIVVRILLRRQGTPSSRLSWIVVVLLVPIAGPVLYFMFGEVRLGRGRVRRHKRLRRWQTELLEAPHADNAAELPVDHRPIAKLAESVGGTPARHGNALTLLSDSARMIDALVADIDAAEQHCHLTTYIYLDDSSGQAVAEALERATSRGVICRVLVDAVGSKHFLGSALRTQLEAAGVQVRAALPVNPLRALFARLDVRNHRKLAIIDGRVAYTGSQNIADAAFAPKASYAPWVDATIRVRGPVVWDLQRLFIEDWYLDANEWLGEVLSVQPAPRPDGVDVQVIGTGPMSYNYAMRQVQQAALHLGREEVVITSPYLVPDEGTAAAIHAAARCGTRVCLVVPARNDSKLVAAASRGFYSDFLDSGVHIREYLNGLLHAKTLSVDGRLSILGSANLDRRSFELNFELSLIVYDEDFTRELRALQARYMAASSTIIATQWQTLAWPKRLYFNAAGLFGGLL
ncbi:cardiolipin synthase [Acidihalobacter ferrooxydans]|uniref:Cardiolipin synthase n=1 Tax=Acidihalobacter ferrooxydans TaxID=1765967 RepID=A0A1P8UKT5_9GAMM|nr:cardiolipin synthase [Acidihalobacter ferrooxydans]